MAIYRFGQYVVSAPEFRWTGPQSHAFDSARRDL